MLNICYIEDWFDQFQQNVIGSILPKLFPLAECDVDFGFLEFFDFDLFDELESLRIMLIWN